MTDRDRPSIYADALPFEEPDDWTALTVGPVSTAEGVDFIAHHHYAGRGGQGSTCIGLYRGLRLVGVAAFAVPVSGDAAAGVFGREYQAHVMDLQRFVLVEDAPKNSESWFLARALRAYKAARPQTWAVTSFADRSQGHLGTIYQATNALYSGTANPRWQYIDQKGHVRSDRLNGVWINMPDALARGWQPVRIPGKHRYLFLTPDSRAHARHLRGLLRWTAKPYPKREASEGAA